MDVKPTEEQEAIVINEIKCGNVAFLRENFINEDQKHIFRVYFEDAIFRLLEGNVEEGKCLDVVKWFHDTFPESTIMTTLFGYAAMVGNKVNVLRYLHSIGTSFPVVNHVAYCSFFYYTTEFDGTYSSYGPGCNGITTNFYSKEVVFFFIDEVGIEVDLEKLREHMDDEDMTDRMNYFFGFHKGVPRNEYERNRQGMLTLCQGKIFCDDIYKSIFSYLI